MRDSILRWGGLLLLAVVLALTFSAYLRPEFMLDLANRFVMCF